MCLTAFKHQSFWCLCPSISVTSGEVLQFHAALFSDVWNAWKRSSGRYCWSVKRLRDLKRKRRYWELLWPEVFSLIISSFSLKLKAEIWAAAAHIFKIHSTGILCWSLWCGVHSLVFSPLQLAWSQFWVVFFADSAQDCPMHCSGSPIIFEHKCVFCLPLG